MMLDKPPLVLLYGDVDLSYVDGSAVWLLSIARALLESSAKVTLLLKARRRSGGLFEDLDRLVGIDIVDDFATNRASGQRYSPTAAAERLDDLAFQYEADIVICRGRELCIAVSKTSHAGPRLWAYMTDIPQAANEMHGNIKQALSNVATRAHRVFAQTNKSRDFLEHHIPAARGKTLLLSPMIPDTNISEPSTTRHEDTIRLVYAGKFARWWNTLEMCDIPRRAALEGLSVSLTMIGDKFQNDPDDSTWTKRMRKALSDSPGVKWVGALSREQTIQTISEHDIGLSWRHAALDASHELSTKLLEYMATGTPPIVNRTVMHEELLGDEYPFFVDDNIMQAIRRAATTPLVALKAVRDSVQSSSAAFTIQACSSSLSRDLNEALVSNREVHADARLDVLADSIDVERLSIAVAAHSRVEVRQLNEYSSQLKHYRSLVTDSAHLTLALQIADSVLLIWDDHLTSTPRPPVGSVRSVLITDPSLRRTAAWWARIPISQVAMLPDPIPAGDARPKISTAPYTVGVVIDSDAGGTVRKAHEMLATLRSRDTRYTMKLLFPHAMSHTRDAWEREDLIDALSDLSLDTAVCDAWGLEDAVGSTIWFRELGWIAAADVCTIQRFYGNAPHASGCIVESLDAIADHITCYSSRVQQMSTQPSIQSLNERNASAVSQLLQLVAT